MIASATKARPAKTRSARLRPARLRPTRLRPPRQRRSPERSPAPEPGTRLSLADLFTLTNGACGFLAICSMAALFHDRQGNTPIRLPSTAVMLLFLGATCDLFDGQIARRFGGSCMGAHLDNLADAISFGLAPAFLVGVWGTRAAHNPFEHAAAIGAATICMLSVLVRLARFAAVPTPKGTFMGLPCPMGALTVVAIVLLDPPVPAGALAIVLVALLMVSRITYPKPQGPTAVVVLLWIAFSVASVVAYALGVPGGQSLVLTGAALQILFTLVIPLSVWRTART
jgi:CDP-diacylglycerol--serine O-phosphatidyltransferase